MRTIAWPQSAYPLDHTDRWGCAFADAEGENQSCACGNDSQAAGWVATDRNGVMDFTTTGSADGTQYTLCPVCGRVYPNDQLAEGVAAPVAVYSTTSRAFLNDLAQYNHDAYGDTPS